MGISGSHLPTTGTGGKVSRRLSYNNLLDTCAVFCIINAQTCTYKYLMYSSRSQWKNSPYCSVPPVSRSQSVLYSILHQFGLPVFPRQLCGGLLRLLIRCALHQCTSSVLVKYSLCRDVYVSLICSSKLPWGPSYALIFGPGIACNHLWWDGSGHCVSCRICMVHMQKNAQ